MKTLATGSRISLMVVAGFALATWAVASNPTTAPPPGTPVANPPQAKDPAKAMAPATPVPLTPPRTGQAGPMVSFQAEEIVKLTEGNVGAEVIQTHIAQSTTIKFPNADEIIYLHQHGVSDEIIAAFIRRGGALQARPEPSAYAGQPGAIQPAPAAPAPASVPPSYVYVPQPSPPVDSYAYPNYVYMDYPSYSYGWPAFGWSVGYYSPPFGRYNNGHLWPYYGGYRSSPRGWAPAIRPGSGFGGHVTFGAGIGANGHSSGGGLGRRPGR